jgi:hypothetical protein
LALLGQSGDRCPGRCFSPELTHARQTDETEGERHDRLHRSVQQDCRGGKRKRRAVEDEHAKQAALVEPGSEITDPACPSV